MGKKNRCCGQTPKFLRKFGDKNADWATNYMEGFKKSRNEFAAELELTMEEFECVEMHSEAFKRNVELAMQRLLNKDIARLRTTMVDKGVNGTLVKLYFALKYNIGDKPKEVEEKATEEYGFDITVRKKGKRA